MSRNFVGRLGMIAGLSALGACGGGGGGGGVASTAPPPAAPATPPAPANASITNLVADQSFSADTSRTDVAIDRVSGNTTGATTERPQLTIAYNAATNGYTVNASGRSSTFLPTNIVSKEDGETRYQRSVGGTPEYLTLVTTPYGGTTSNRYVALGYWQRNQLSANLQQTGFDAFTFGLETSASAVPRSGRASFATDVFGLYTAPAQTPRTVQGNGDFTVDFASGHYATSTFVDQFDFLTGASVSGGGISVESVGRLGSGNSFSGDMSYGGSLGTVAGTLTGRFYGPGAEELGAAFRADNAAGASLTGAMTGQRKATPTPTNFTLDNLVTGALFYSTWSVLSESLTTSGRFYSVSHPVIGQTSFQPDGSFQVVPPSSDMPFLTFTEADRTTASRPDFVSYHKSVDGTPVWVDLYRPGNPALKLTYAGFGTWTRTTPVGANAVTLSAYFTYGLPTPRDLLSRRTGSATYSGPAFGTAGADGGGRYAITGASEFGVNFTDQRFTGSLTLEAVPVGGSAATALGTWQFGAPLSYGLLASAPLSNGTAAHPSNVIVPRFFGPEGNEIAATFGIVSGATIDGRNLIVSGATVAKRR